MFDFGFDLERRQSYIFVSQIEVGLFQRSCVHMLLQEWRLGAANLDENRCDRKGIPVYIR